MRPLKFQALMGGLFLLLAQPGYAESGRGENPTVVFASVEEGKRILGTVDDFIERLSPFDRTARMKTDREVSRDQFLAFVRRSVLPWESLEKTRIESAFLGITPALARLSYPRKGTIYLIKTTGEEEGHAAYTRGNAIVLSKAQLALSQREIRRLLAHEFFHILSRRNQELRDLFYQAIGFEPCDEIEYPSALRSRKITNPDAPRNDHCIRVHLAKEKAWAVPILFSRTAKYDVARGGEFFDYLTVALWVAKSGDSAMGRPQFDGLAPRLVGVEEVSGFFEQVGRNTDYLIHPEEILADNFALLVLEERNVPSPDILEKMRTVFARIQATKSTVPAAAAQPSP